MTTDTRRTGPEGVDANRMAVEVTCTYSVPHTVFSRSWTASSTTLKEVHRLAAAEVKMDLPENAEGVELRIEVQPIGGAVPARQLGSRLDTGDDVK